MNVMALVEEQALIAQAKAEPSAFAAIYDHYFPRVFSYIRYHVRDAEAADDITAQIFEKALIKIKGYRPERAPFADWLFAIARNAVTDHLRSRMRYRWLPLDALRDQASDAPQPEDVAIRNETLDRLRTAVSSLSDREREIIALKFAARLTNRSISRLCGLTESNVAVILSRAIGRLRIELCTEEDL
ncbi:MAG TPA: sigma-70 family RNA polymerase sigma factor [bacterium]|nr:sigma-70 family RNA polymerase sigma factor [bacterium]